MYGTYVSSKAFWSFRDDYCRKLLASPQNEVIKTLKEAYKKSIISGTDIVFSLIKEL